MEHQIEKMFCFSEIIASELDVSKKRILLIDSQ